MHARFNATILLILMIGFSSEAKEKYEYEITVDPGNITIARDTYGVPHIFGKTDAEVAYGLAWANAEDGFHLMQEALYSTNGKAGKVKGIEGAAFDFFVHAMAARETVEEKFYQQITLEYRRYLEGYCQGINAFAKAHPDQVLTKKIFPVTPLNVVQAYLVTFSALVGAADPVAGIIDGSVDTKPVASGYDGMGSNAFAMSSSITKDDKTYLCANPHFMVEGPLTFYEAHLHSEEGLNITGAIFQGGTSIFIGSNENLGWGQTWNHFDGVDVYKLKMHPKKKLWYEVDGEYYKLEKRPVWLKVALKKHFTLPVRRVTYWGKHGMVLKSKNGNFYAVKSLAFDNILAGQQYYYMNKARNYEEFMDAMRMQGIGKFNIIYADRYDNIYYVSNGLIPDRDANIDWSGVVPGDDSKLIWQDAISLENLPHNLNPECGYVFNTNNTPFHATCDESCDDATRLPSYVDQRPGNNNRARRFLELVEQKALFSYEDFKALKFDYTYPDSSKFLTSIQPLLNLDPEKYPDIAEPIRIIKSWDKVADTNSISATMYGLCIDYLFKGKADEPFVTGLTDKTEEDFVKALAYAQDHLLTHFGTLEVPMKKIQRFVRGEKDYTVPGGPDFLMANYARIPYKDGSFKLEYGDTYIHFVKFSKDGAETIETLLPFNTLPTAEKYKSQIELYQQLKTKKMSLDKEEIMEHAVKKYHPISNK